MKPIKPRYSETVKVDWKIPKQSKLILSLYARYTKYDEEYIVEQLINEITEDANFKKWLDGRRYNKKVQQAFGDIKTATPSEGFTEVVEGDIDF